MTTPDPVPADRSADRSEPARPHRPAPRTADRARAVRDLAEQTGGPPSQYAVKQALGIGSGRAARLLAELGDPTTAAGDPGHNAAARKEGTR